MEPIEFILLPPIIVSASFLGGVTALALFDHYRDKPIKKVQPIKKKKKVVKNKIVKKKV